MPPCARSWKQRGFRFLATRSASAAVPARRGTLRSVCWNRFIWWYRLICQEVSGVAHPEFGLFVQSKGPVAQLAKSSQVQLVVEARNLRAGRIDWEVFLPFPSHVLVAS